MVRNLKREFERMKCIRDEIQEILRNPPTGRLRCIKNKGTFQYYCGTRYLRKSELDLAKRIAYRDYCEELLKPVNDCMKALDALLRIYDGNRLGEAYRKLSSGRKVLISPIIKPIEDIIREFDELVYEGKAFDELDMTEYYTMKSERVRSKSEKIIADELHMKHIPYKYEMPIQLENRGKIIQVYPDFTALNKRTGKKWIIEHLGMMDKEAYFDSTLYKLDLYERNGWLQGKNLILLHESSSAPLNTMVVKQYIEEYLC